MATRRASIESHESFSVKEIYQLIDDKLTVVNGSIRRLEDKFDNLEAGRLSVVEKTTATIEGKLLMIPLIITIAVNGFFFVANWILGNMK